jgi:hypothetical protein
MRSLLRRLAPYLLLALLGLPALWPLAGPGLPRTNDALPHFYRAFELSELFHASLIFPRWAPHLVHGFGYPVFNFFPYLAHALVAALHLAGLDLLPAYNFACGLALFASAAFAFQLGRDHFGPAAGLVAGVAYVYSPYLLYDTYVRGSLPENLALALLPLALLHVRRASRGEWHAAAWAALALAAALLSHHGVMLQAMPFILAYALFAALAGQAFTPGTRVWQRPGRNVLAGSRALGLLLPFVLALLLSAFFWLPALLEARYVQTGRGTGIAGMSYVESFLSLPELLAWPRLPVDPHLLNPPVVRALPQAALLLAVLAGLRWLLARPRPAGGRALLFFTFAALGATLLILPPARPFWDTVPLLRLTLFPWRLLGPTSLFLALGAGALFAPPGGDSALTTRTGPAARRLAGSAKNQAKMPDLDTDSDQKTPLLPQPARSALAEQSVRSAGPERSGVGRGHSSRGFGSSLGLSAALALLLLAGLPFAAPPREAAPAEPTLADLAHFEIPPDFIGTTTVGEYLPVWVEQLPDTSGDRLRLMLGEAPPRFDAPGAVVTRQDDRPVGVVYSVNAAEPVRFVHRVFYFPGWHALLDGQRVPLEITTPDGLMAVAVPSGTHTLTFSLGPTVPRLAGAALTLLGLLALAARLVTPTLVAWRAAHTPSALAGVDTAAAASELRLMEPRPAPIPPAPPPRRIPAGEGPGLGAVQLAPLFLLAILLALARPFLFDAGRTPLLRHGLSGAGLAGVQPLNLDIAGELTLLGAKLQPTALTGDDDLAVHLYWRANHRLGVAYGFEPRLVDAAGQPWSEPEVARPRDWRFTPGTDFWPTDQYILDPYMLTPRAGLPPGDYTVQVKVFARHNLREVGRYPAGTVTITAPTRRRVCPEAIPSVPAAALDLRTAELPPTGRPGDDLPVSLCWQAAVAPGADFSGELRLLDAGNEVRAAQPFTLGGPYPASRWAPGDVLRDLVTLRVPAELETGEYTWAVVVSGGPQIGLGLLAVTAPDRMYATPPVGHRVGADLGPITLYGLALPAAPTAAGAQLPVTLYWRADETPPASYHVFLHLEGPAGALAAQSDGVPADWSRRTTGWLRGEFVADARVLTLPADLPSGSYSLFAGLYDPATGARLTTPAFPDGRVLLSPLRVE